MISFRYRNKKTAVHKLNPFSKLAWVMSVFILTLIFDNPLYLLLLFLSIVPWMIAARVWREWASLMKFALILCLAVVFINVLVSQHGSHLLWQATFRLPIIGAPAVSLESLVFGVGMSLRLITMLSAFAVLIFAVHPDDLMAAMVKLKVPYKSVLVTSLSTRFVPTLIDDVERISDVQRARGLELDGGNLVSRLKSRMAVILPLLSNSLDRTVQVAEAMEARAFGTGGKRTFYHEPVLSRFDIALVISGFLPLLLGILMRLWGQGDFQYYPALSSPVLDAAGLSMLTMLVFSLVIMLPVAALKGKAELD